MSTNDPDLDRGILQLDPVDLVALPSLAEPAPASGDPEAVVIELAELLPDEQGEVVLFADETMPVQIATSEALTQSGIIDGHTTATGMTVDGLHYYSFENGVTLYSPIDLLITGSTHIG